MMCISGQRTTLAGFEIHTVPANAASLKFLCSNVRFLQQIEVDAETIIGFFRAGYRLKDQIDRCSPFDGVQGRCHVRQHAGLCRYSIMLDDFGQHLQ